MKRFADTAAEFVPAVERVFGERPRVLDGARAVLLGDVKFTASGSRAAEPPSAGRSLLKLQLEAGERELWLIECRGALEHYLDFVPVEGSIEEALRAAKEKLHG